MKAWDKLTRDQQEELRKKVKVMKALVESEGWKEYEEALIKASTGILQAWMNSRDSDPHKAFEVRGICTTYEHCKDLPHAIIQTYDTLRKRELTTDNPLVGQDGRALSDNPKDVSPSPVP